MVLSEQQPSKSLLLIFSLPAKQASQRRKLKRYGAPALRSFGYFLPTSPDTLEPFEVFRELVERLY